MASPYAINGALNFGSICASQAFTNPIQGYAQAYNNYLSANQTNYNNIVAGYNSLANTLYGATQNIQQGYTALSAQVLGTLQCSEKSQLQAVQCTYTKQNAMQQQQSINSGLGNSTVLASLQRGVAACEARAQTAVQNQYANTIAGYQSNLGLASLNYQNQAAMEQAGLGTQALGFLASVQIPPPCMAGYAQMYNANRAAGIKPGATNQIPPNMPRGVAVPARGNTPGACYGYGGGGGGNLISGGCGSSSSGSNSGVFGGSDWGGYGGALGGNNYPAPSSGFDTFTPQCPGYFGGGTSNYAPPSSGNFGSSLCGGYGGCGGC